MIPIRYKRNIRNGNYSQQTKMWAKGFPAKGNSRFVSGPDLRCFKTSYYIEHAAIFWHFEAGQSLAWMPFLRRDRDAQAIGEFLVADAGKQFVGARQYALPDTGIFPER